MASTAPEREQMERLGESAAETMDRASQTVSELAERWSTKGEELLAMKDEYVESTREYVKQNPLVAVGIAVAAGFLLGKLTSRD